MTVKKHQGEGLKNRGSIKLHASMLRMERTEKSHSSKTSHVVNLMRLLKVAHSVNRFPQAASVSRRIIIISYFLFLSLGKIITCAAVFSHPLQHHFP